MADSVPMMAAVRTTKRDMTVSLPEMFLRMLGLKAI
jgi:hypothetical protein